MTDKKVLVLNSFLTERFSKDGRCQTEEGAWLDTFPSVMLPSIAGVTREKYKTMLLDCVGLKKPLNYFLDDIENFSPDLTVINTSTGTILDDIKVGEMIKKLTDSQIAIYGEHATFNYEPILKQFDVVDFVVRGEAETPTMRILEDEVKNDGIVSRDFVGNIWREPDLDALPFPAYDLMPTYRFPLTGEPWTFIRSGRGCPYTCIFCIVPQFYGRIPRLHSPEYMIKQLKWVVKDLHFKLGMFWDDTHTLSKPRVMEICNGMINTGISKEFGWMCTTRADRVDEELIKIMKLAGCEMLALGIESGNQEVLDNAKKLLTLDKIEKAVSLAKKYKIKIVGHFILGLPTSDIKKDMQTIKFATKMNVDFAQFYSATPYFGSEFYSMASKNKWITDINNGYRVQKDPIISYPNYTLKQIALMRRLAYKRFYFNHERIKSLLTYKRFTKNPLNIVKTMRGALKFLKWSS